MRFRAGISAYKIEPSFSISKKKLVASDGDESVAIYGYRYFFFGLICRTRIAIGNWEFRKQHEGMREIDDDLLLLLAINEEYLHWILHKAIGLDASEGWDNLTFELRNFLLSPD